MAYHAQAPIRLSHFDQAVDVFTVTQFEYRYRGSDPHTSLNIIGGVFIPSTPAIPGKPGSPAIQAIEANPDAMPPVEASPYVPAVPEVPDVPAIPPRVRNIGAWRQIVRGADFVKAIDLTNPEGTLAAFESLMPQILAQGGKPDAQA
jgi:hypothetical protein